MIQVLHVSHISKTFNEHNSVIRLEQVHLQLVHSWKHVRSLNLCIGYRIMYQKYSVIIQENPRLFM